MAALALEVAEHELKGLETTRANDEHWDDADIFTDMSVELALNHVQRMKTQGFGPVDDFCWELSKAGAPLSLAVDSFSRKDCMYMRRLHAAVHMFEKLTELVRFTSPE